MEPEIELELFAALCADVEAGRPLVDVLQAEGLSETRWNQSREAWIGRMSYGPENERKSFEERYLIAFHARKRLTAGRDVALAGPESTAPNSAEAEDPPTRRAPMGTIIPVGPLTAESPVPPEDTSASKEPPPSATPPMGVIVPTATIPVPAPTRPVREYTPPMGVAVPNLADLPPPRPLPNPEHTPPMGVAAPNLADLPPPRPLPSPEHAPPRPWTPDSTDMLPGRSLPKPEHTPPMGVAAPNLADIPPPRPLPSAEHTPPMGVAAPNLADIPPPRPLPSAEHTPPMGVAAPNFADAAAQRPRRMPEPTPPMRPRAELVPDEMVRAAAEVVSERKTDPPPPVPSRPALPFPPPPSVGPANLPVPMPPPSAAFRPTSGNYPAAPAPTAGQVSPPMAFQQAPQQPQPPAAPTFGSYPSMMNLAAQAAGPVPPPSPSSAGFPAGKPQGAPLALGGFPASATGPRLTLDVYARFAAEIAVKPVEVAEIRERYGFTDVTHTAEDEAWQRRFSSDRDTYVRYAKLFQHYRDWYSGRTPR